jgi:hypothetical protein
LVRVKLVVPADGAKLVSPEYAPVTASVPAGAVLAVHEPDPALKEAVQSEVLPTVNVTVPVGVPVDSLLASLTLVV